MAQRVFEALTSPVRREILTHLAPGPLTAGEIAGRFEISKPAVSQHLTILQAADLVSSVRRGQFIHYTLTANALRETLTGLLEALAPPALAPEPIPEPPPRPIPNPEVPRREGTPVGYRWEAWRTRSQP